MVPPWAPSFTRSSIPASLGSRRAKPGSAGTSYETQVVKKDLRRYHAAVRNCRNASGATQRTEPIEKPTTRIVDTET